ncbi:MAG: SDR family oxidoreductase [Azospirillaceae bacterium]|nr:SDR family oxidoreductase [Azospirillaceae bacterium]
MDFTGKTAVVTGGAGGIGGAISATLARLGARVTATAFDPAEIDRLRGDPACAGVAGALLDVRDDGAVQAFATRFPALDILVNCAGTTVRGERAFTEEGFDLVLDVNLFGTMRAARAFLPQLTQAKGTVVNIASMMSFFGSGTAPGYAASKGGVAQLTKSLAIAWAEHGIRVNAVAPGWIITPLTEAQIDADLRQRVIQRTPMRQWGVPQHIADAVSFLCSPQASFITGAILPVDGGYSAA